LTTSDAFRKIAKSDYKLRQVCPFVRLSVCLEQLGSLWTDFVEVWYLSVWVFVCLSVWAFECLGVWAFERLSIWAFECLSVWAFEHLSIWAFECLSVPRKYVEKIQVSLTCVCVCMTICRSVLLRMKTVSDKYL